MISLLKIQVDLMSMFHKKNIFPQESKRVRGSPRTLPEGLAFPEESGCVTFSFLFNLLKITVYIQYYFGLVSGVQHSG